MSLNVSSILSESARFYPDRIAVVLGDHELSYSFVWTAARHMASVLEKSGVTRGDAVALMVPNIPQFPIAYYAILSLGAVVVPIHSLLKPAEVEFILADSGAVAIVASIHHMDQALPAARACGIPLHAVAAEGDLPDGATDLEAEAKTVPALAHPVACEESDPAVILYTSGTTGKPKGAVLTQSNMTWQATVSGEMFDVGEGDVFLGCLPLFHAFGQSNAMNTAFRTGATLVLLPRFDAASVLDLLEKRKITVFLGVPTMYVALLAEAKGRTLHFPHLKMAVSGGAALPEAVLNEFKERFGADIYEGYGLSETSPAATFNQPHVGRKPGSIGTPLWGFEVEIADAEKEEEISFLPDGEIGEIVIRGHGVMKGYLGNEEATRHAIVDGWFRSGDLGYRDADGYFFIVDRKKDMIIRGGYNIYPREVEEVLHAHPRVRLAAVFGMPDDTYGEEIVAVVVLDEEGASDAEASRASVHAHAKEKLAAHKYPRVIWAAAELPLGPSGKVLKRELKEQYATAWKESGAAHSGK